MAHPDQPTAVVVEAVDALGEEEEDALVARRGAERPLPDMLDGRRIARRRRALPLLRHLGAAAAAAAAAPCRRGARSRRRAGAAWRVGRAVGLARRRVERRPRERRRQRILAAAAHEERRVRRGLLGGLGGLGGGDARAGEGGVREVGPRGHRRLLHRGRRAVPATPLQAEVTRERPVREFVKEDLLKRESKTRAPSGEAQGKGRARARVWILFYARRLPR